MADVAIISTQCGRITRKGHLTGSIAPYDKWQRIKSQIFRIFFMDKMTGTAIAIQKAVKMGRSAKDKRLKQAKYTELARPGSK